MDPFFGFWPKPSLPIQSDASLLTRGLVLLALGTGAEEILHQVGDLITGITVLGVGNYDLALSPQSGIVDSDRCFVFAQPYDLGTSRTVTVSISAPNSIRVRAFLANGTASPLSRIALAIYYEP
jgi:hypothetical protein